MVAHDMPACRIIVFPLVKRVGRIREVADKMLWKPTDKSAEHYRKQVTEAALVHLQRAGIPPEQQDAEMTEFWQAVQDEIVRQACEHDYTGGTAA